MPNHQALDEILSDILSETTQNLKTLIGVDRATLFLVNPDNIELCLVLSSDSNSLKEIRIPNYTGIPGDLANLQKFVDYPFNPNYYTASHVREKLEPNYITYNLLSVPLLNPEKNIVAFVQFLNKLKDNHNSEEPLSQQVDLDGFNPGDEETFYQVSPSLYSTLQRCQSLYAEIKKQRVIVSFIKAIHAISQSGLDLDATLKLIAHEAKELMNADRCQLWLVDTDSRELWTKVFLEDGLVEEQHLPIGVGFVGRVAESGQPINIPFDLYDRLDVDLIQRLDQSTGYRTCSLLCMPIFDANHELIGVIELINKHKLGNFPEYSPDDWPLPPERFKASFNQSAQKLMNAFNIQVGLSLQ
ncbi:MAG TPA: GAF domain-containing protein, partial [Coleofasciculaceae cyanobacterium]